MTPISVYTFMVFLTIYYVRFSLLTCLVFEILFRYFVFNCLAKLRLIIG